MNKFYIYSNIKGFNLINVPTATKEIDTMISTFKEIYRINDEMNLKNKRECAEKVKDIIETIDKLESYYFDDALLYNNIQKAKYCFELNYTVNMAFSNKKWDNTIRGSRNAACDLSKGVVYFDPDRYIHLLNPSEDIYEYNGRMFYMWDGWHSSLKVMKEIADKQFNK